MTLVDLQRAFVARWAAANLTALCPVKFDRPQEGDDVRPPYLEATVKTKEVVNTSMGPIWKMRIDGTVYLPQGSGSRELIETRLADVAAARPVIRQVRVTLFRRDDSAVEPANDPATFAGGPVERFQAGWDLWCEGNG